jgi:hypothetical protein
MAPCIDAAVNPAIFPEKGYAQLPRAHRVCLKCEVKFHPYERERPDGFPGSAGELSCRSIRFVA